MAPLHFAASKVTIVEFQAQIINLIRFLGLYSFFEVQPSLFCYLLSLLLLHSQIHFLCVKKLCSLFPSSEQFCLVLICLIQMCFALSSYVSFQKGLLQTFYSLNVCRKILGVNLGILIDVFVRFTGGWRPETIRVQTSQ